MSGVNKKTRLPPSLQSIDTQFTACYNRCFINASLGIPVRQDRRVQDEAFHPISDNSYIYATSSSQQLDTTPIQIGGRLRYVHIAPATCFTQRQCRDHTNTRFLQLATLVQGGLFRTSYQKVLFAPICDFRQDFCSTHDAWLEQQQKYSATSQFMNKKREEEILLCATTPPRYTSGLSACAHSSPSAIFFPVISAKKKRFFLCVDSLISVRHFAAAGPSSSHVGLSDARRCHRQWNWVRVWGTGRRARRPTYYYSKGRNRDWCMEAMDQKG